MESINILWFKRDFRLSDHQPLFKACESGLPLLMIYVIEPLEQETDYYDDRHLNFILQSAEELNEKLHSIGQHLYCIHAEWIPLLKKITAHYNVKHLLSHQETGLDYTYQRDIRTSEWCKENHMQWHEFPQQAVIRGLQSRKRWDDNWKTFMLGQRFDVNLKDIPQAPQQIGELFQKELQSQSSLPFQQGGRKQAVQLVSSFLQKRHRKYMSSISQPTLAAETCSRLSPYIAWGCISIREVYQSAQAYKKEGKASKRDMNAFQSRLAWHCHMIQKLETEPEMQFRNMNDSFDELRTVNDETFQQAFFSGQTGFPMIDASIRCLKETGYLNFRMRACLVSFFTHHGWQDWRDCAPFLGKLFLDLEPGIHLYQHQMQACTVGAHTIRIYNPEKQALENDPKATFIRKWIPELKHLPVPLAQRPYIMTPMEQQFYNLQLGKNYPHPILDLQGRGRFARETIHAHTRKYETQLKTHTIQKRHMR